MREKLSQPRPHHLLLFVVEELQLLQSAGALELGVLDGFVGELSGPSLEPFVAVCEPESLHWHTPPAQKTSTMYKTKTVEPGYKPNSTISHFCSFFFHCFHDRKKMFIRFLTRMWSSSLLVCISCFSSSTIFSIASFSTSSSRSDICGRRQRRGTGETSLEHYIYVHIFVLSVLQVIYF